MKAERLRDAIWKIDDKFIKEAETYVPKKRSSKPIWIITSASAAVIAIISCVNLFNTFGNDHRPEISNYVVTTTVTDEAVTEDAKISDKTERSGEITIVGSSSETVYVNTEETETGYESSIPNAVTVPKKTEAPSGNGGSSSEKTVVTQKPQDVTKAPATEPAVVTSEVQTAIPVTEPVVITESPATAETNPTVNPGGFVQPSPTPTVNPTFHVPVPTVNVPSPPPTVNPTFVIPMPTSPTEVTMVTEKPPSGVTDPDYVPKLQFMEINSAIKTIQKNDVSVYSGENREAFCEVHDRLLTDGKFFVQTAEKPIDAEKNPTVNILTRTEKNDICIEYNLYYKNNVFIIQFCYADKETAGISSDLSDYLSRRLNVKTDSYLSVKDQSFLIECDEESYMKKIYSVLDDYHYMRIFTDAGEKDITEFLEAFSFETTEIRDLSKNNMG